MASSPCLRFGRFELDADGVLRDAGVKVALRARPLALLRAFLAQPGRLLTKEALLDAAWPGLVVEENNLQVQVSVLRRVLGAAAIATVAGRGYRFTLEVEERAAADAATTENEPDLVERDAECAAVREQLASARLVTITGAGGVGKTSLARAVVKGLDGWRVCWLDLAPLSDAALLTPAVQESLTPAGAAAHPGPTLVVLDNAEHLLEACAQLVDTLLPQHADLRMLVTSQAPLRLPAEHVTRLQPLALPAEGSTPEEAAASGAITLFLRRARACDARVQLDGATLPVVVDICRRLDGLPLALELAAARVPAFGLRRVAALLDERFRLLAVGHRTSPARQQTLRAVYDWTYGLLREDERRIFRRLGVLSGSMPLEALMELVGQGEDPWSFFDVIAALVAWSLLQMDDGDPPRYRLLESARADAMARLLEAPEQAFLDHACSWYEAAGDRAAQGPSGTAALAAYGAALDLLHGLPASLERDQRELALGLKLGPAIQSTLGPAHARCEAVYRRSVALARGLPPGAQPFQALWGYWQFLSLAGRDREAAPLATEIADMATTLQDDALHLEALHAEMTSADLLGDVSTVVERATRIGKMYDRCRHHPLTFAFGGHDPGVCALGQGAVNHWLNGDDALAAAWAREALALAATLDHGYSQATAAFYAAIAYAALRDRDALSRTADALVRLSDDFGMEMLLTEGRFFQGRARWETGERGGLAQMREALCDIEASGDLAFIFVYMALYAQALLEDHRPAEVIALVERGLGHARLGQALFLPELLRLRALARRDLGDARWREDAREAVRLAESQGAKALAAQAMETLGWMQ